MSKLPEPLASIRKALAEVPICEHRRSRGVGVPFTALSARSHAVALWCPDCGALKPRRQKWIARKQTRKDLAVALARLYALEIEEWWRSSNHLLFSKFSRDGWHRVLVLRVKEEG